MAMKRIEKEEGIEHNVKKMLDKIEQGYNEEKLSKIEYDMWMAVYRRQKADKESKIRPTRKQKRR